MESSGMRDVLRRLKADRFEEIIAVVALYRPGPMDNIPSYINRKHGDEKIDYLYPSLEGILKETFGIMIYQEQVMQIAQELAGYSLGGADLLRRAMGKKIRSEMLSIGPGRNSATTAMMSSKRSAFRRWICRGSRWTTRGLTKCWPAAIRWGCSSWSPRACAT